MYIPLEKYFARDSASVDWCEDNYVYSNHIAEFWNTVSSAALLVYPLMMLVISYRYTRFFTSKSYGTWLIHCTIGVASIYFHATLSLAGQLMDESAILWVLMYTLAIWLPVRYYDKYMQQPTFQICIAVTGVVCTLMGMISPVLNAFCLVGLVAPFAYVVISEVIRFNIPVTNALCMRLAFFGILGFGIWGLERAYCDFWQSVGFPYLHSIWHLCICIVGHEVCIIAMYFHSLEHWKDLHTEVAFWPKSFPRNFTFAYMKMTPKTEANNNIGKQQSTYVIKNGYSNGQSRMTKRL